MNTIRVFAHNKTKCLKETGGKACTLGFSNGGKHVLLPNGQQIRHEPKDRTVSGKTLRRQRNAAKREIRAKCIEIISNEQTV